MKNGELANSTTFTWNNTKRMSSKSRFYI